MDTFWPQMAGGPTPEDTSRISSGAPKRGKILLLYSFRLPKFSGLRSVAACWIDSAIGCGLSASFLCVRLLIIEIKMMQPTIHVVHCLPGGSGRLSRLRLNGNICIFTVSNVV